MCTHAHKLVLKFLSLRPKFWWHEDCTFRIRSWLVRQNAIQTFNVYLADIRIGHPAHEPHAFEVELLPLRNERSGYWRRGLHPYSEQHLTNLQLAILKKATMSPGLALPPLTAIWLSMLIASGATSGSKSWTSLRIMPFGFDSCVAK